MSSQRAVDSLRTLRSVLRPHISYLAGVEVNDALVSRIVEQVAQEGIAPVVVLVERVVAGDTLSLAAVTRLVECTVSDVTVKTGWYYHLPILRAHESEIIVPATNALLALAECLGIVEISPSDDDDSTGVSEHDDDAATHT